MGVSENGGFPQKWMLKIVEKTTIKLFLWDDLGGFKNPPIFGNNTQESHEYHYTSFILYVFFDVPNWYPFNQKRRLSGWLKLRFLAFQAYEWH